MEIQQIQNKEKAEYFIGSIAAVIIVLCLVPQLISIIKKKSAKDISIESYLLLLTGQLLWGIYGGLKGDIQLIVSNIISCVITINIIILGCYYKNINKEENYDEEDLIQ